MESAVTQHDEAFEAAEVRGLVRKEEQVNLNIAKLKHQVTELQESLAGIDEERSANRDPEQITVLMKRKAEAKKELESTAEMLQAFESLLATIRGDIQAATERFHDEKFNEALSAYREALAANREKRLGAHKELLELNSTWLPKLNCHRSSFPARVDYDTPQVVTSAAREILDLKVIPDVEVETNRARFALMKMH